MAVLFSLAGHALADEVPGSEEVALEFTVNSQTHESVLLALRDSAGGLWLTLKDMSALRLAVPNATPRVQGTERYFPLAALAGVKVTIDDVRQRALIEAPAAAFAPTRLSVPERTGPMLTHAAPGAFLNYQISAQRADHNTGGAYGELGLFGPPGVLTWTGVARDDGSSTRAVRLDTTFTRDFPESLRTLSVGDAISDPGNYGNSVRFGGFRLSRNYSLRPDLLTMPLLSSGGSATLPSTVDVFVNNQLVSSETLPPGPFTIERLPAVSGSGEISIVVRDVLGREQVLTRSFYASTSLLRRGLTQFALDVGSLRENYALNSSRYGPLMAQGTYRRGVTDGLTLEGHAELHADGVRNAGVNAAAGVGHFGVLNFTAAGGGDSAEMGWLGGVGFERRGQRASFVASTLRASPHYRQIGDATTPDQRFRTRTLFQSGFSLGRAGALALAYARQSLEGQPTQETLSMSHSLRIGAAGMLAATATRMLGEHKSTAAFLIYTMPIGQQRTVSAAVVSDPAAAHSNGEFIGTMSQSASAGPSTGYRASATSVGNYDLAWNRRFESTELQLEAVRHAGMQNQSAYLSGAATLLGGELHASRSVTGSFAVVEVGGVEGVPVYLEHQAIGTTNANGRVLVSDLRPYESNRVGINPRDLPLDTHIEAPEVTIAPPYRSGVIARIPITKVRQGTFRLLLEDGRPVPVGAWVDFNGERFPVVLDGFVYVTNFDQGLSASAHWRGGSCRFRVETPPVGELMPDMGSITCRNPPLLVESRPDRATRASGVP